MSGANYRLAEVSLTGDREQNQDRCIGLTQGENLLLVLGDGLGGHPRGETAAQILIDTASKLFKQHSGHINDPRGFLEDCLQQAHRKIVHFGDTQNPPISPRTTAVLALVLDGRAYWGHVGDSRLYLLRNGETQLVTEDHSLDSSESGNRGAITRCLGGPVVFPKPAWGRPSWLQPGDILLLCSDGFWDQLDEQQLGSKLSDSAQLQQDLNNLAEQAAQTGARRSDNVTALALQWHPTRKNLGRKFDDPEQLDAAVDHLQQIIKRYPGRR